MRYTRQLVAAVVLAAAALGMGACSAHPGAAVVTSTASYSNEEVAEAVRQLSVLAGAQSQITGEQIRAQLINEPILEAAGTSVGTVVTDEQIDQINERVAQSQGITPLTLGPATRATVKSILLTQALNQLAKSDPSVVERLNQTMTEAREAANVRVNPRFAQPSQGGAQAASTPLFGDAVAGNKQGGQAPLQGGTTRGGAH